MDNESKNKNELMEKVHMLYDLELNIYLMTRAISLLDKKIQQLCVPQKIPVPKKREVDRDWFALSSMFAPLGAILGAIVGLFVGCSSASLDHPILSLWGCLGGSIVFGVVGCVLAVIAGFIISIIAYHKQQKKEEAIFQEAQKRYSNQVVQDKKRVEKESKQRWMLLEDKNKLVSKRKESKKLLTVFYNIIGIDDDFRSLICMGYMYDYLRLGIATSLEGTHGLYKQVLDRLGHEKILEALGDISDKLDILISQNDRIYHELRSINDKCDNMITATERAIKIGVQNGETLQKIQDNTQVSAYNQERLRIEYEYNTLFNL